MDIGGRGGAGCGIGERVIRLDLGRGTREGTGETSVDGMRAGEREFSQIRRSLIHDIE